MTSASKTKPGIPLLQRKWFLATAAVLVVVACAVVFAPVYLRGYVRGIVEREVGARVNGVVTVDAVRLGWFSPQRLEKLAIQGGQDTGSVEVTAEVAQGLLALATGDEVTVSVSGSAQTPIDAQGRAGLAKLPRAAEPAVVVAPPAAPAAGKQAVLGGRKVRIELDGIDLDATRDGKPLYTVDGLTGWVGLEGTDVQGMKVNGELKAVTGIAQGAGVRAGDFEAAFIALVPQRIDGSFNALGATGSVELKAKNLPVPSAAGQEIFAEQLSVTAAYFGESSKLSARGSLRADGEQPATIEASFASGRIVSDAGEFVLDPATVEANIDVKALPMTVLQPYAPELREGVRLDFVEDFGRVADIRIKKEKGRRANALLDTRRVKVAFDAAVAADGGSIDDGTLEASVSVRPELLRALGVDALGPMVARAEGSKIAWRKPAKDAGGGVESRGGIESRGGVESVGGAFTLELAERLGVRGAFEVAGEKVAGEKVAGERVDVRADSLRASVEKTLGERTARLTATLAGVYGAESPLQASLSGNVDLAAKSVTGGALDASVALEGGLVERVTKSSVSVARGGATAKLSVPAFAYRPSEGRGALQSLEARGRVEVVGDLLVSGGESVATVRGLGANFALPAAGAPGSLDLAARIDGAETRVVQRFAAIPASFLDPAALGLDGTIDVRGLDPSVITRFAPAAKDSIGVLGAGPMTLSARNRTEGGAILADFTLAAATLNASGNARYAKDAFSATNLACDVSLTPEVLAAAKLPDTVALAPGAKASVRVPTLAVAKGAEGWAPSGDIAARVAVDRLRIERAPGLLAALEVPRLEADATYAMKDERATAKGFASLGAGGSAGRLGYDIVWKKPAEAKLFRGVEGTLALTGFDLARVEGALGLEPGGYSGMLGGAGDCTVELRERGAAQAKVALAFPKTRGSVTVDVVEEAKQRVARATGSIDAQIAADAFASMAGLGKDPKRRVTAPVDAKLAIKSAGVPLDADLKPVLADAALDVSGSLSPVSIEVTDAQGQKSTVSTGALALSVSTKRLSDELLVRIVGDGKAAAQGALDLDARVRGAVARAKDAKATPIVDATLKATKFPAATVDALAGTKGAVGRYIGDAIDAEVVAKNLSTAAGSTGALSAKLSSQFATVDAPALTVSEGFLRSSSDKPMRATFTLSPEVREQLLTPINPVFSDVTSKERARFTLDSLAWPLDGDRRKFDAAFTLETGEIQLTNAGPLAFLLSMLQAGRIEGFEAQIDPLRVTVSKGRLTYRDFSLRAGKTQTGAWRNSLVFSGDIDLTATPMYANEIRTAVPLSDAANWSRDARGVFERIGAVSPELLKSLSVGVKLSGPLFDANGKPAKLNQELALPDILDVLKRDPGAVAEGIGGIIDAFRKKDKK
ncbi:MAG: hypothetical protein NTU45_02935 [Planctomycetota bacterium]|nr:hypothetical protein [Planctomycetota bacterium]